jgi:Uma2 family endonuclease
MTTATQPITAEQLIELPSGEFRYELVKGELFTMSPSGEEHGAVTVKIASRLFQFVETHDLGIVYGAETGFKLESDPDTVLAPDVAFIRRERIGKLSKGYRIGAPDLAVEVISPRESKRQIEQKTTRWLQGGALAVWNVYPESRTVTVHHLKTEPKVLSEKDDLTDDDVLPGFRLPLSQIFF